MIRKTGCWRCHFDLIQFICTQHGLPVDVVAEVIILNLLDTLNFFSINTAAAADL